MGNFIYFRSLVLALLKENELCLWCDEGLILETGS